MSFFIQKTKNKKYANFVDKRNISFDKVAEEAINSGNEILKSYILYIRNIQKEISGYDFLRILRMMSYVSLPKPLMLEIEENDEIRANLKILDELFLNFYYFFIESYRSFQNEEDKFILFQNVPKMLQNFLSYKAAIYDDGRNLADESEEESLLIYLRVFLFDYLGIGISFLQKKKIKKTGLD